MSEVVRVDLWGTTIGAAALEEGQTVAGFEYEPAFLASGIEPAPLTMPLAHGVYRFPGLPREAFRGLPGMLADSLPDRFGDRLMEAWLARQGRAPESAGAIERLCYVGARGMGALTFAPALGERSTRAERLHMDSVVALASQVMGRRGSLAASFAEGDRDEAIAEILRVGTSAGGARAKAIVVWNRATNEVRSGQGEAPPGFEHWLLKFDGVRGNRDRERADPQGFGAIEYAYSLMAGASGVRMPETRLLEDGAGRRHFMARRFDRTDGGDRLHMQTLGALAHLDYNDPAAHSYEEALLAMRRLALEPDEIEEQFRRMCLNVLARNQDDHVKNVAFLMDRRGRWSLSPAYDFTFAHNPRGAWTARHQMSVNGRREAITRADLRAVARAAGMVRGRAEAILDQVREAVARWPAFAAEAAVSEGRAAAIEGDLLLDLPAR